MIILSPSVLAADFTRLNEQIYAVGAAGCEYLHLDVMDGHFVPNITFGQPVIESIRKNTDMILDVHLMITDPLRYVDDFVKSGADIITFHYEACENIEHLYNVALKIKEAGIKCSVSIKPATPAAALMPVLYLFDMILVMSVEPGFGGQKFIPSSLEKVRYLAETRKKLNYNFLIEIDGGVNAGNISEVKAAGTDVVVAGTAIFGSPDIPDTVRHFKRV